MWNVLQKNADSYFPVAVVAPGVEPDVAAPAPTPAAFSALRNDVMQALFRTAIALNFETPVTRY
jgi:hypothetical protein